MKHICETIIFLGNILGINYFNKGMILFTMINE